MAVSKHYGEIYSGKWKYIGNYTFENIYNGRIFKTDSSNVSHIFSGRTTVEKLMAYQINGKNHTQRKRQIMWYASQRKKVIE